MAADDPIDPKSGDRAHPPSNLPEHIKSAAQDAVKEIRGATHGGQDATSEETKASPHSPSAEGDNESGGRAQGITPGHSVSPFEQRMEQLRESLNHLLNPEMCQQGPELDGP